MIFDDYKEDLKTLGLDKHTIETYLSNINFFFLKIPIAPENITNMHLQKFLNYLRSEHKIIKRNNVKIGASKSTINGYFSALLSFYDFLVFSGKINHNPIPNFRRRYLE